MSKSLSSETTGCLEDSCSRKSKSHQKAEEVEVLPEQADRSLTVVQKRDEVADAVWCRSGGDHTPGPVEVKHCMLSKTFFFLKIENIHVNLIPCIHSRNEIKY